MNNKTRLTEGDRKYLAAIDTLGGSASTREIRKRVDGWDDRAVRYRHNRHQRFGTIEIHKDNDRTPHHVSAMKVAELTDDGEALIAKGAAADEEVEKTTEEQVEQLATRIEELEETMNGAFPWMREVIARVRRLETAFEDVTNESVEAYGDVEDYE
jgi:DNA-binding transcriptional MerR regulator